MINLPPNCTKENQKIVFAIKLQEEVRLDFNAEMKKATTIEEKNKSRQTMMKRTVKVTRLRDDNVEIARVQNLHDMSADNIVDGKIVFPTTQRPKLGNKIPDYAGNEGARASALHGLSGQVDVTENDDFRAKLHQATEDAKSGHLQKPPFKWQPKLEDII